MLAGGDGSCADIETGGEGAKYWLGVLTELNNRGIADVLIVCCDGLSSTPGSPGSRWSARPRG